MGICKKKIFVMCNTKLIVCNCDYFPGMAMKDIGISGGKIKLCDFLDPNAKIMQKLCDIYTVLPISN